MLNDAVEIGEDVMLGDAEHMPAEAPERTVPRCIGPRAAFVVGPIDLDDEPHLRAGEVSARRSLEKGEVERRNFLCCPCRADDPAGQGVPAIRKRVLRRRW